MTCSTLTFRGRVSEFAYLAEVILADMVSNLSVSSIEILCVLL